MKFSGTTGLGYADFFAGSRSASGGESALPAISRQAKGNATVPILWSVLFNQSGAEEIVENCLEPVIHSAGHEGGRRAGTESALLAVGLGKACELARDLAPMDQCAHCVIMTL
jgi:hypothetical protein